MTTLLILIGVVLIVLNAVGVISLGLALPIILIAVGLALKLAAIVFVLWMTS